MKSVIRQCALTHSESLWTDLVIVVVSLSCFTSSQGALHAFLRRKVSGASMRIVLGHCTFVSLVCRGLLSIFSTVYAFVQKLDQQVGFLWESCRLELEAFASLLFPAEASWTRQWSPLASSTDASEGGWGWAESLWPISTVCEAKKK